MAPNTNSNIDQEKNGTRFWHWSEWIMEEKPRERETIECIEQKEMQIDLFKPSSF